MACVLAAESASLTSRRRPIRQLLTTMVNTMYTLSETAVISTKPLS